MVWHRSATVLPHTREISARVTMRAKALDVDVLLTCVIMRHAEHDFFWMHSALDVSLLSRNRRWKVNRYSACAKPGALKLAPVRQTGKSTKEDGDEWTEWTEPNDLSWLGDDRPNHAAGRADGLGYVEQRNLALYRCTTE